MTEQETSLTLLEDRLQELELKIVGKTPLDEVTGKVKPVSQSLHEVDTVLLSTVSGREKINNFLKKVDVVEEILDPAYLDVRSDTDAKLDSVLQSEEYVQNYVDSCARLKELEPVLNEEAIQKLPSLKGRIDKLFTNALKQKEQCDKQTENILQVLNDYRQYTLQVSTFLVDLEAMITNLEIDSKAKRVVD